jgi:hypothetical protein
VETVSDIFAFLGIKPAVMVAGLAGGALRALSRKRYKLREMIASPICGALAAAYLTDPAAYYARSVSLPLPPDDTTIYATAFLLGVGAMWISDIVFDQIVRRFKPADDT